MRFINFTSHTMTDEQVMAARVYGRDENPGQNEVIDAKDCVENFTVIVNDDGKKSAEEQAEAIASAIASIIDCNDMNIIHFPVSSPRVMAAFWKRYGHMMSWNGDFGRYARTSAVWDAIVHRCKFVFSHTERESVDVAQKDGSVKKTAIFRFKGFVEI